MQLLAPHTRVVPSEAAGRPEPQPDATQAFVAAAGVEPAEPPTKKAPVRIPKAGAHAPPAKKADDSPF